MFFRFYFSGSIKCGNEKGFIFVEVSWSVVYLRTGSSVSVICSRVFRVRAL